MTWILWKKTSKIYEMTPDKVKHYVWERKLKCKLKKIEECLIGSSTAKKHLGLQRTINYSRANELVRRASFILSCIYRNPAG